MSLLRRLSDHVLNLSDGLLKTRETGRKLDFLAWQMDQMQREFRLVMSNQTLPASGIRLRDDVDFVAVGASASAFPHSTMCRQASFEEPYFAYWAAKVGSLPIYHRKLWEFVFICQALWERGVLCPGARGLGFGVGEEPLTAFFASQDCQVVATDLPAEAALGAGWIETEQHASAKENLRLPRVCPDSLFDRNVEFQPCDMTAIPSDLRDFDFCWSACALEHLGSIEAGLEFIERSLDTLAPGGWAAHTTEFNLSSNDHTLSEGPSVLFRQQDFEELARRLTTKGHRIAPLDFEPGLAPLDRYIDLPPYREEPHLKLAMAGYVATSFGIIIQRAP